MQLKSCTKSATSRYFLVFIWSRFGFYFIGSSCSSSSSLIFYYSNVISVTSSCINSALFINKKCSNSPKIYILYKCLILDQQLPMSNSTIKYVDIHMSISSSVLFPFFFSLSLSLCMSWAMKMHIGFVLVLGEYSHAGNIGKGWVGNLVPLNCLVESPIRGIQGGHSIKSHKIIWEIISKFSGHGLPA